MVAVRKRALRIARTPPTWTGAVGAGAGGFTGAGAGGGWIVAFGRIASGDGPVKTAAKAPGGSGASGVMSICGGTAVGICNVGFIKTGRWLQPSELLPLPPVAEVVLSVSVEVAISEPVGDAGAPRYALGAQGTLSLPGLSAARRKPQRSTACAFERSYSRRFVRTRCLLFAGVDSAFKREVPAHITTRKTV